MNEETNELMNEEIQNGLRRLNTEELTVEQYKSVAEALATLIRANAEAQKVEYDHLEKVDKLNFEDRQHGDELEFKEHEEEASLRAAKNDQTHRWIRVGLDGAAILLPLVVYTVFGVAGLKFEETGTFTSFIHKQNLGQIFRIQKRR